MRKIKNKITTQLSLPAGGYQSLIGTSGGGD
jgi:hypothetical protein